MKTLFLTLLLSACAFDAASAAAITITGGTETTGFPTRTQGFNFFTNAAPVTISQLGFYDSGSDGLNQSHEVGIWTADGSTLIASAIVPSGTAGTLDSGFRFVAITPVVLAANTEYLAGAFNGDNTDAITRFATATTDPRITLGSTRFDVQFSGVFTAPTGSQGQTFDDGYFGPNFQISADEVPEPAAITLVAAGIALAILKRRHSL